MRFRRVSPLVLCLPVALAFAACQSETAPDTGRVPDLSLVDARSEVAVGKGWLDVKTLQIHLDSDVPEPTDVVLRGTVEGFFFSPSGEVEGELAEPPVRGRVERAWLELRTRRIVYMQAGIAPEAPWLAGRFDQQTALFYPEHRAPGHSLPAPAASSQEG